MVRLLICLFFSFLFIKVKGQSKWPIPIIFAQYKVHYIHLPDSLNMGDTIMISYDLRTKFKLVFFKGNGESYCEVYRNNVLFEKGFYLGSLDTLKSYISTRNPGRGYRGQGMRVFKYFEPLRHGEWILFRNGKALKKQYYKGVEINNY